MLLNWDTKNVCIVSSQWHIRSTLGLILSLFGVIVIAAGYEALRAASRKYELAVEKRVDTAPSESSLPLPPRPCTTSTPPPLSSLLPPIPSTIRCIHASPSPLQALEKEEGPMRATDS